MKEGITNKDSRMLGYEVNWKLIISSQIFNPSKLQTAQQTVTDQICINFLWIA
jgi:hypothetical protein